MNGESNESSESDEWWIQCIQWIRWIQWIVNPVNPMNDGSSGILVSKWVNCVNDGLSETWSPMWKLIIQFQDENFVVKVILQFRV